MNLTEFRTRVMSSIGLSGSTEQGYVDNWVNEGVEQVLLRTKAKIKIADVDFTANEGDYELPSILALDRITVTWDGRVIPLEPMDSAEIDWHRQYASSSACPRYYAVEGHNMIRVWPVPDSALDSEIRYVPKPTAMSSGSDTPDGLPTEYHPVVEAYAKWKAAEWDDDSSSQVGRSYLEEYEMGIKRIRRELQRRRGPMAPARLRRPQRVFPVDNGVDYAGV